MTPGERMEEKYKLLERFCRQTWINHGMIGGGVATLLSAGTMLVAQRKSSSKEFALIDQFSSYF